MEEKTYSLKEASKELEGRFTPDHLRVKCIRGEIQGIKVARGQKMDWHLPAATLRLLQTDENTDLFTSLVTEWGKAQRHGTHGNKPKPVSEKTITSYKGYLDQYFDSIKLPASIENLNPDNFERCMWTFVPDAKEMKDHWPTRQKIYNAVTSFYLHLIKRGYKNESELLKLRKQKPRQTYPEKRRVLTIEQWKAFYNANNFLKGRTEFDKELSQTLILLYTTAGLRRSEAMRLQVDWINLETGQMEVLGKNNKWRIVFANPALLAQIKKWVSKHRPKSKHPNLLLKDDGEPITFKMVQSRIDTIRKRAGLDIDIHGLRRTFATLAMEEGTSVNDVQELLGHDHLSTTEKYVRTNKLRAAKSAQKLTFGICLGTEAFDGLPASPNQPNSKRIIRDEYD
jgi:site-specific recombinase XerD